MDIDFEKKNLDIHKEMLTAFTSLEILVNSEYGFHSHTCERRNFIAAMASIRNVMNKMLDNRYAQSLKENDRAL